MRYAHGMGIKSPKAAILCGPRRHEVDMAVKHGVDLKDILNIEMKPATMSNFTRSFTTSERTHQFEMRIRSGLCHVGIVRQRRFLSDADADADATILRVMHAGIGVRTSTNGLIAPQAHVRAAGDRAMLAAPPG